MSRKHTDPTGSQLAADFAGMFALTVLLFVGLYLPHLV